MIPEFGSSRKRQIKILVTINLDKPLLRGTNLKLNNVVCWVDFKHEQLAAFCYYYGRVGHSDIMCVRRGKDLRKKLYRRGNTANG